MVKHLYLMRHGETLFNVYHRIQGWCDSPLTPKGIEQAKKAKQYLKDIPFDHYYCSTAERTCDTLEIVTDRRFPYTRLKGLKERYFGMFEGQSEDLLPSTKLYDNVFPLYGGESSTALSLRMFNTLREVMDHEDHQIVLAVSHCGASMNFLHYVDDLALRGDYVRNCETLHFTYENGKFTFVELIKLEERRD